MSGSITGRSLNEMGSVRICIDEYDRGEMSGRIYEAFSDDPVEFGNVISLLKNLDDMYNSSEYPQASMRQRSFGEKKNEPAAEKSEQTEYKIVKPSGVVSNVRGKVATFRVKVMFRQNASWQGNVTWVEKGKEESFRSALELIMLMDSSFAQEAAAAVDASEDLAEAR